VALLFSTLRQEEAITRQNMYGGGSPSGGYQIPDVRGIDASKLIRSTEPDFIPGPTPADKDFYRQAVNLSGSLWLTGMGLGGLYGGYEGYKGAPGTSYRVVSNSVLNGISKRGTVLGNRLAVICKYYYYAHNAHGNF
jgi:hypothetical protein